MVTNATQADVLNSLIQFFFRFAAPPLADEAHVLDGFGNNRTLPADGNDVCIVTPIREERKSSTIVSWEREGEDVAELLQYVDLTVQADCYGSNVFDAHERAQTYCAVANSPCGTKHFRQYGIDCLYAEGAQNLSAVIDSGQYVSRWTFELRLGYWTRVRTPQDFFTAARVGVVNVDSKFH